MAVVMALAHPMDVGGVRTFRVTAATRLSWMTKRSLCSRPTYAFLHSSQAHARALLVALFPTLPPTLALTAQRSLLTLTLTAHPSSITLTRTLHPALAFTLTSLTPHLTSHLTPHLTPHLTAHTSQVAPLPSAHIH